MPTRHLDRWALRERTLLRQLAALDRRIKYLRARLAQERRTARSRRHHWSKAELQILRAEYADAPTQDLAHKLGRKVGSVYQKAIKLGLAKSATYLASPAACRLRRGDNVGAATRFAKGIVPHNKGLRRPGWAPGRMRETQFKKGRRPHTWKPVGTERINADGYLDRKVSDTGYPPRDWRGVHILLWEQHNGPVPPGHAVVFRDANKTHIAIDNLELLTRAQLMSRNSYHNRYPKEIALAIQLRGALIRKINHRSKHREEQDRGPAQPPVHHARGAQRPRQADGP